MLFGVYFKSAMFFFLTVYQLGCTGPKGDQGPIGPSGINGENGSNGVSDKQTRIYFPYANTGTSNTSGLVLPSYSYIIAFNKANHVNVDSIVFVADLSSDSSSVFCQVELFNVTANEVIGNSLVQTSSVSPTWCYSKNIYASLPSNDMDLSIRIKSTDSRKYVWIIGAALLLYRK